MLIIIPGLPPNRSSVEHLVGSEYIDEAGRIKVNPFLQVEGLTNIYAVGDCCDTKEDKMAAFAGKHGETVAANLLKAQFRFERHPFLILSGVRGIIADNSTHNSFSHTSK